MNIKELEEAKRQLEDDIRRAIAARIEKFTLDTGQAPEVISVEVVKCWRLMNECPNAVIGGVSVDLGVRL